MWACGSPTLMGFVWVVKGTKCQAGLAAQTKLPGVAFDARNESSSCGDTGLRMDIRPVPR